MFRSPDLGMLGYVQGNKPYFYHVSNRKNTADIEFDVSNLEALPQVDIIYGYASMNRLALDAFVGAGAKGIVQAGVGDGSIASPVKPGLVEARQKGVVIVRSSRIGSGIIARNGEANDDEPDFVVSDTLSPQKARILLMLALTKTNDTTRTSSECSAPIEARLRAESLATQPPAKLRTMLPLQLRSPGR